MATWPVTRSGGVGLGGPLNGVRVVELCSAVAGPLTGKLLGDMGADVVKVENPQGSADRVRKLRYDQHESEEFTYRFLNFNTSKRSLAVDLKTDGAQEVLARLVAEVDVVIENMRPGSMERLGFDWQWMQAVNPDVIFCSIKGYGGEGPYSEFPAVDTLIQGVSGMAMYVGEGDRPGTMDDVYVVDVTTALYAAWAITMALFERGTSGDGQRIDVSMLDAAVSHVGYQLAEYTGAHHHPEYEPTKGSQFAPNGYFATADGYLALMIPQDHWANFTAAIEHPEWAAADHQYATNAGRVAKRHDLRSDIETALASKTTHEWMAFFRDLDAPILAAPVNDIDAVITDPQVEVQNSVAVREHPVMGRYYLPNVVPRLSRTGGDLTDAPRLGEHTTEVLTELGFSADQIDDLYGQGSVG